VALADLLLQPQFVCHHLEGVGIITDQQLGLDRFCNRFYPLLEGCPFLCVQVSGTGAKMAYRVGSSARGHAGTDLLSTNVQTSRVEVDLCETIQIDCFMLFCLLLAHDEPLLRRVLKRLDPMMEGERKLPTEVARSLNQEPRPPMNKSRIIGTMLKCGYLGHHESAGLGCLNAEPPLYLRRLVSSRTNRALAWWPVEMHPQ
jgi:hypothetical protein